MTATETNEVITQDLRANLKKLIAKELDNLPEYLEILPAKDRLNYLIKLMPYVFPKLETIRHNNGESSDWSID